MSTARIRRVRGRTRVVRRTALVLGVSLALLVCAPEVSSAQDRDKAFRDGMEAYNERKWDQVIKFMTAAIAADPQERDRIVEYGGFAGLRQRRTEYLPHYYLGEARFRQQQSDCSGAVDAWARSETAGVVIKKRQDLQRTMEEIYVVCKDRGVLRAIEYDQQLQRVQKQYDEVFALAQRVTDTGNEDPEVFRQVAGEAYDRARQDIRTAAQRISSGRTSRAVKDLTEADSATKAAGATLTPLISTLRAALDRKRSTDAATRQAQQQLQAAGDARKQLEDAIAASPGIALPPSLSEARQRANGAYERGRDQYVSGSKAGNQASFDEAVTTLRDAENQFRRLLEDFKNHRASMAERLLSETRTAGAQALKFFDDMVVTLDRRVAANPALAVEVTPERDKAVAQGESIRRRLENVLRGDDAAAIGSATRRMLQSRDMLYALTERFGPLTLRERGVSQALEDGAARFFAGQYEEALTQLKPAGGFAADDPLQLHVHLFRAASLYAQYAQSRGTKPDLRTRALAEIDECKKIDSSFQPDPRAFSPRFLALYRDGGDGLAAAAPQPK